MSEIDELRKRKMEELREQIAQQQGNDMEEHLHMQQQIEMLEQVTKQHLSGEAITRFGNLKMAHPEKAIQIVALIAQGVQAGQIKGTISDEQFKELLRQIQPSKKEFRMVKK